MKTLPHIATRLFNTPLLITQSKLNAILSALAPRLGLNLDSNDDYESVEIREWTKHGSVAVLPIYGSLIRRPMAVQAESGLLSYAEIKQQLSAILVDTTVKSVVLDIDSPGGEVSGLFDLVHYIRAAANIKPIYAIANDSACSAAYAIASAANKIYLTNTAAIGSIGVIAMHIDQSQQDAQSGISYTPVYAGQRKNDFSPHEPLNDTARSLLQQEIDRIYTMLVQTVATNRNLSTTAIKNTEAGVFFGSNAVAIGLANDVITLEKLISNLNQELQMAEEITMPEELIPLEEPIPTDETESELSPAEIVARLKTIREEIDALMTDITGTSAPAQNDTADPTAVAELCSIAGHPELTHKFLHDKTPIHKVRHQLLQYQSDKHPIHSYATAYPTPAKSGRVAEPSNNYLVELAKAKAEEAKEQLNQYKRGF